MGAIKYDFDSVPSDEGHQAGSLVAYYQALGEAKEQGKALPPEPPSYRRIYEDLAANEYPLPTTLADTITRAELIAHLQRVAGDRVKAELQKDPDEVYADATSDAEVAALFNGETVWFQEGEGVPVWKQRPPATRAGTDYVAHPIARVLRGLPLGPNALTAADITAAKE